MVSNQVFLKPRSSIREVGKVYGLSNEEIKDVTKRISWYSSKRDLKNWIKEDIRFSNINIDKKLLDVLKESEKIIGVLRYSSVHPGGVIIVPDEIKKYVRMLKLEKNVTFLGWITEPEKSLVLQSSDIFIMTPSQVGESIEGFGMVFIDAAFHGIASIGTNSGGISDAVLHNKTGLLCLEGDQENITKNIDRKYTFQWPFNSQIR